MALPRDSTSKSDLNDKWLLERRKDAFPSKVDWTVRACNGTHIWLPTEVSGCCVALSSQVCRKVGPRKICAACKIVVHEKCIAQREETIPKCQMTFREETSLKGGDGMDVNPQHHIVYCRKQNGKCDVCGKGFQSMSKLAKSNKPQNEDFLFLHCTWCKRGFHMKECSKQFLKEEFCDLGEHKHVILPPSWIVKLPSRKYSFSNEKNKEAKNKKWHQPSTRGPATKERRAFVVKAVEGVHKVPLIIFVNPKSGGNQGFRILKKCQYLLNPRQVFDLSSGGPHFGLDLYRNVPNLRILVCGGDGSVGWVLSEIDRLKVNPSPSVCVLPLGTGNDLARFLGWGGGYADEPLSKIITHAEEGGVQKLDRWDLDVLSNGQSAKDTEQNDENAQSKLPLNVMNNYFSMGADADIALQFHESREANPERFNSRVKNKLFYGKCGAEAMVRRKNVDLHKCIESLICDGVDLTARIRELKPISIVFLNISSFGSGTSPWGHVDNNKFLPQRCDDGYLEVVGLTTKSLASTRVGGHGMRIFQCQSALFYTNTKLAMQVDGEPCRLSPSRILIKRRNQANMIMKKKPQIENIFNKLRIPQGADSPPSLISTQLCYMNYTHYTSLVKHDINEIKCVAQELGTIQLNPEMQLDDMRKRLETMRTTGEMGLDSRLGEEWCFLDASWTSRIYRIDDSQEYLLRTRDVIEGGIFVLDLNVDSKPNASVNSTSSKKQPTSQLDREGNANVPGTEENADRLPHFTRHAASFDLSCLAQLNKNDENDEDNYEDNICHIDSDDEYSDEICIHSDDEDVDSLASAETDLVVPTDIVEREEALFGAAKRGMLEKFQRIYKAGTCLFPRDVTGRTPLHLAVKYGRKEIVNFIVEKVTPFVINIADKQHLHTPLHVAALYKRRTICRSLIAHGASATRGDIEGMTPRILALNSQDFALAKYLRWQERLQEIATDDQSTAV